MDKIVISDWGGVVENHENGREDINKAKIRIIKRFNNDISDAEILARWTVNTSTGISISTTNSEKDIKDWVNQIQKNMNIDIPIDTFKQAYEEEYLKIRYYKDVVEYIHSLKDKCKIAILSNLIPFDKKRIDYQYDLSKFDFVYLSFEVGLRKPDKRIYDYVSNELGVDKDNILFIDDDENNIEMAKKCGWNTCKAFGYELEKIKSSVDDFLNNKNI